MKAVLALAFTCTAALLAGCANSPSGERAPAPPPAEVRGAYARPDLNGLSDSEAAERVYAFMSSMDVLPPHDSWASTVDAIEKSAAGKDGEASVGDWIEQATAARADAYRAYMNREWNEAIDAALQTRRYLQAAAEAAREPVWL